jgi:hypothetical protein
MLNRLNIRNPHEGELDAPHDPYLCMHHLKQIELLKELILKKKISHVNILISDIK